MEKIFTGVLNQWNRLPGKVVRSPYTEILKT